MQVVSLVTSLATALMRTTGDGSDVISDDPPDERITEDFLISRVMRDPTILTSLVLNPVTSLTTKSVTTIYR